MTFEFYLGGFGRSDFWVRLQDGQLQFTEGYSGFRLAEPTAVAVAGTKELLALEGFLKSCRWKKTYDNGILDGTQWELKLKMEANALKCYGSNAYPPDFDVFLKLLNNCLATGGAQIKP